MRLFATILLSLASLLGMTFTSCTQMGQTANNGTPQIQQFAAAPAKTLTKKGLLSFQEVGLPQVNNGELLLKRSFYATAFNKQHCQAAWVMWALTPDMVGVKGSRAPFIPDNDLPAEFRVEKDDYSESGYSRGHMMPAGDCKFSSVASVECAFMSNICPQTEKLNAGPWNTVEMRCRDWAKSEGCIYIVCGPIYDTNSPRKMGRSHKLDVPDAFFKVILSLNPGKEKALGFVFSNTHSPESMQDALCPVSEVEKITGLNFFGNVDPQIAQKVKNSVKLSDWKYKNLPQNQNRHKNKNKSHH